MSKKKILIAITILSVLLNCITIFYIGFDYYTNKRNKDIFRLNSYSWANKQLNAKTHNENRVIFIGNSITENWTHLRYTFFKENNYVSRGIGGQTSPLLLLRFRQDVIELKPKVVVLNTGINDMAENTGEYDPVFTLDNIKSMAQLAEINGIKVVLTSVLPCRGNGWKGHITDVPEKIISLNEEIKAYAEANNYAYVDYYTSMVDDNLGMKAEYTFDGLHPTEKGYEVMEPLVQKAIKNLINQTQ